MKKIFVLSLGCPRNLVDSEVLSGQLVSLGFLISESAEGADIAIVNTCGFIDDAKRESLEYILQLAEMKRSGKIEKLIIAGCLSQRYPEDLEKEIPEIDAIFGSSDFLLIPEALSKLYSEKKVIVKNVSNAPGYLYNHNSPRQIMTPSHSVYVKIQEGCSNVCSYCIIPYLKGPRRSRDIGSVVEEVVRLKEKYGVKEIILIGQDTTSFGFDRPGTANISELLREVAGLMSDGWVRLLYTHPAHFPDELIKTISSFSNICKYVDLFVQHMNNSILHSMNRNVSRERIIDLIEKIRASVEGVVFRTSVMVGFPGETEEHFSELISAIEMIQFDRLGAFVYSQEEGTPASSFTGQVPEKIKKSRFKKVMELQQSISAKKNKALLGKTLKVLIDERDEKDESLSFGRTEMDAPEVDGMVYVRGKDVSVGDFVDVKITGFMEYDLTGEAI